MEAHGRPWYLCVKIKGSLVVYLPTSFDCPSVPGVVAKFSFYQKTHLKKSVASLDMGPFCSLIFDLGKVHDSMYLETLVSPHSLLTHGGSEARGSRGNAEIWEESSEVPFSQSIFLSNDAYPRALLWRFVPNY